MKPLILKTSVCYNPTRENLENKSRAMFEIFKSLPAKNKDESMFMEQLLEDIFYINAFLKEMK